MSKKQGSVFAALLLIALPLTAAAPQYGANAASMFVDPITEPWDCDPPSLVPANRCYSGSVQGNGSPFGDYVPAGATGVGVSIVAPKGSDLYWIGGAFGPAGPGSGYQNGGDNFVIFHSPNTHNGRRAQGGTLTLMNDMVRPDDSGFWAVGGFHFYEPLARWIIATVTTYPTGNQNTMTDIVFYAGESFSAYTGYSWRPIVHFKMDPGNRGSLTDYGVRWHYQGNHWLEDPSDPSRWIGVVPWTNLAEGGVRGSAPAVLDFSQESVPGVGIKLCLGFRNLDTSDPRVIAGSNSQHDFYCYHEADGPYTQRPIDPATGLPAKPARMVGDFVRSVAKVTTTQGTHGEIWLTTLNATPLWCADPGNRALLGYGSEDDCALDRNFCGSYLTDPGLYLYNRANLLSGKTEKIRYFEWNLSTLWKVGSARELNNDLTGLFGSTRGWPSPQGDHGNHYFGILRYDWNEFLADGTHKEGLYVGVKRSHCLEPLSIPGFWMTQRWHGNGSAFLNLLEQ